jgi:hypothetical protein
LFVDNDVSLNSKLFVTNDVSLNSRLTVANDVSLNSRLTVANDVSLNSKLFVDNDVSLNSKLFVDNDVSLNSRFFVASTTNLVGDVSMNGNLDIGSGSSSVAINKDISSNFALDVSGITQIRGNLDVAGAFTVNGVPISNVGSLTGNVQVGTNNGFVTIDKPQFYSDPSLTIYYDFDSASYTGTTIANKGNGGSNFTATLQGTTTGMIDTGNFYLGTASLRNEYTPSNNQGIKINSTVPIGTNMTFSFWLRKKSTPPATTFDRIFEYSNNTTVQGTENNAIALDISSSGIILPVLTNVETSCFGALTAPIISYNVCNNTWNHIIWSINGSSSNIYVNGSITQQDTITGQNPFSVSPTRTNALIGNSNFNVGTRDFSGNIDDFRYYKDKALSYAEIYQLYNNNFYTLDICGGFLANGSSVIYEASGSVATANRGTLTLLHGDASGSSSIMFKSVNDHSDYGYIEYDENVTGSTGVNYGLMTIGIENDAGSNTTQADRISLFASGGTGFVGVNTKTPQTSLDVSGQMRIYEGTGTTASATNGSLTLEHANTGGVSSLVFKASNSSTTSDYAYVQYEDNPIATVQSIYKYDFSGNISVSPGTFFTNSTPIIPSTGLLAGSLTSGLNDSSLCWTNATSFPTSFPTTPTPYCISFNQYNLRDNSSARINYLQSPSNLTYTNNYTISTSFWINPSTVGSTVGVVDISSAYNILDLSGAISHPLSVFLFRSKLFVVMDSSTNPYGNSISTDVSVNNWYHIAFTANSITNNYALYKNNVLQSDICGNPAYSGDTFTSIALGWRPGFPNGTRFNNRLPYQKGFHGNMAYVNVFNTELNNADVSFLYQNPGYSSTPDRGLMTIGIENDGGYINNDRIALWPNNGTGFVGVNTKTPQYSLDVSGTLNTNADVIINGVSVGKGAGNNSSNTVVGYQALKTTSGSQNVAIGYETLLSNTTGSRNVGVGYNVLSNLSTQTNNTAIGYSAGNNGTNLGNNNTFLGSGTDMDGTWTNSTAIGYNAQITESNQIQLGNASCTAQATSFTATSDYREKENVLDLNETFTVDTLRPVVYDFKPLGKKHIGFIAHEVQEFYPYLVSGEKDGPHNQSLNYNGFIGILTKEIKDLKKKVSEQSAKAAEQDQRIQALEKMVFDLINK